MKAPELRQMAALPLCAMLVALLCGAGWQDSFRSLPEKAERNYKAENFEQALQMYQEAQTRNPDSDTLAYNMGNTLYQLGRYDEAAAQFYLSHMLASALATVGMGTTVPEMLEELSTEGGLNATLKAHLRAAKVPETLREGLDGFQERLGL